VAQNLPLTQLGGMLSRCSGFVGHDSGISHLAAAVGLPGLILWGDKVEEVWRPLSQKIVILNHPAGLQHLPVSHVMEEILRMSDLRLTKEH